jgi:3-oxoacyl-[acyl-carrier-protein] synthase II
MKRTVITGLGVVSPIGIDAEHFYQGLLSGESAFGIETTNYTGHGEGCLSARISKNLHDIIISDLGPDFLSAGAGMRFGVHAAKQALFDSNLNLKIEDVGDVPVFMGNSEGEQALFENYLQTGKEIDQVNTLGFESDSIPRKISQIFSLTGPAVSIHNTCASSNFALDAAVREVRSGRCRVALCGSSDPFSLKFWTGFNSLSCLGPSGCKPFASDRGTIVISEGAFLFVVEDYDFAIARGAKIYAEIISIGISNDAHHLTNPDAEGVKLAMRRAFDDAKINTSQISFVCAHATGTVANDKNETSVLSDIFGQDKIPPVVAVKSTLGHMMAAAGAANIAATCLSFRHGLIPPSLNSEPADETLKVPVVKNKPQQIQGNFALVNAFGFGGNNAVVILKR